MACGMKAEGKILRDKKKVLELSGVGQIIGLKAKKEGLRALNRRQATLDSGNTF